MNGLMDWEIEIVLVDDGATYLDGESLRERFFVRKINKFLLDW